MAGDDVRPLHDRASQHFVDLVGHVPDTAWSAPTPCADWDVRTLVDHFVRWNTFMPQLLTGKSLADIERPFERDVLGSDPRAAAAASAAAAIAAFSDDAALARTMHHPFGEMPGAQALCLRLLD